MLNQNFTRIALAILILLCCITTNAFSQKKSKKEKKKEAQIQSQFDELLYSSLKWRNIGPFRGGRSCAVTGVPNNPQLFYFGSTGGGVWRTKDGGSSWENISDGFFGGSIGSIAVAESDNNIIYVGGGEKTVRGNVSFGYGIWKTDNAGKTWEQMGLKKSRHVSRIRVHPKNENIVYAAVMGDLYKSSEERGVYRTKDGGKNWERVLFANEDAGAVDLIMDPNNPRILYASTWKIRRTPYSLSSGGEGSGLWKSTDGGDTWENISENKGLPKGPIGIIGVTVSPQNSDRVWALVEAKEGGVFRSEDAGKTWKKINDERKLRQRAWYYTRIYADPKDENTVYVMNVRFHKSKDGGKTFESFGTPHGDHHDLWIAPEDPNRMIVGDDGGAQISYDGAENWSTYRNQPTAQFYRVTTDNHFPYRIYAAQQDNSTIRIYHRTDGGRINSQDWETTAGCECGHIAIDPMDEDIVFGGCYDGYLQRLHHKSKQSQTVSVWPDNPMGHGAEGMKYRFQWNFPLFFSPHNPKKLYTASNHLHVSEDAGQSWKIISPDLTRNDSTKLVSSGGPITQDNTSVEYYCTIFSAVESYHEEGVIWAGSDDGLIHITKDDGENWSNVTPGGMPEWMQINSIEIDPFNEGGLYVAGTRYKMGDYEPYLYKTENYGVSWTKITSGIDAQHFTRVIRADPKRKGLLYAGTESGIYVSFNDGKKWQAFQLNLPIVPITDLALKNDNLIAATQGRSLWMIDDLTVIHQLEESIRNKDSYLYKPMSAYLMDGYAPEEASKTSGQNHPGGVLVHYYLKEEPTDSTDIKMIFLKGNDTIRTFSTKEKEEKLKLKCEKGGNVFRWDMRYEEAKKVDGMILWWASLNGPQAVPGEYKVVLEVEGESQEQAFEILKDERSEMTQKDFEERFDFLMDIREKMTETHEAILQIREARVQLKNYTKRIKEQEDKRPLVDLAEKIDSSMTKIEETLYQTKNQSQQDPLNFPIRLNNKLAHISSLTNGSDFPPTEQMQAVKEEMSDKIDEQIAAFKNIIDSEIPKFNKLVRELKVDAIILEEK